MATKKGETVSLKVDGKEVVVPAGTLLVEAIKMAGSTVPTMCYHPDVLASGGVCRICLVESKQRPGVPIVSCRTPVIEGMDIDTMGAKTREYRQANTAMMFSSHPSTCNTCPSSTKCVGQATAATLNISECGVKGILPEKNTGDLDASTAIHRDSDRCINCDICVHTCRMQGVGALGFFNHEGHNVGSTGQLDVSECVQCGQCINRCPTGALSENSEIDKVLEAIKDPKKHVIFQMAPAIRVAIAEEFGCKPGERLLKNELVTAVKSLGPNITFFDTDFSADLTIIEEGYELIERLYRNLTGKKMLGADNISIDVPLFTSCCPGWVMFMEKNYPDMLRNMSTTKSPMQMLSSLSKGYWAKIVKKYPLKDVVNVAIMPCTAKKAEKDRADMVLDGGYKVTDYSLTTRELAKMLKQANIDPTKLPGTKYDKVMGESTGAAVIFGATGGVMEAAIRTAYEVITGREVPFKNLNVLPVRGMEGIREAGVKLEKVLPQYSVFEGVTLKVAVAHGIGNARKLVEVVKQAKLAGQPAPWHFIEVMACPGGCIGGGGQPKPTDLHTRQERTKLTYQEDMSLPLRKSHENPEVKDMYTNFLKEPLGHNSHHLLHRAYQDRQVRDINSYNAYEAVGVDDLLKKYPKEKQYLLPIVIDQCDKTGYISDPALIKIAKHVGMFPGQVDAIISSYHYFPRQHTTDTHVYLCTCHNCMMKGQKKVIETIKEKYGIQNLHGGVSKDGKFTLHTLNWLGWCVNDAPSMMVKRTGTDHIEMMSGLCEQTLEEKIAAIYSGKAPQTPEDKIIVMSAKRLDHVPSFLETRVNLKKIVKKAARARPSKIFSQLIEVNLMGRGGAGFKTGLKWKSVYEAKGSEKYVVCNADEGLPSTYKDWCLLNNDATRKEVLAGMGICAKTVGAKKCFMYLRYEYRNLVPKLREDVKKLKETCSVLEDVDFEIRLGGGPYVAGEENAQFESIEGFAPLPRKDRPFNVFPTTEGLFHCPTVINNVETFFAVPHILDEGPRAFSKNGLPKLLSVTGDVERPVMLESSLNDCTLQSVIDEIKAKDIFAAEVGGNTEPIIFKDRFNSKLGFGPGVLNAVGSIVLFNSTRDVAELYERKLHFMWEESCKQCVPCRDGSKLFYEAFHNLRNDSGVFNEKPFLKAAESTGATSICAHGKAINPLFKAACGYVHSHNHGSTASH